MRTNVHALFPIHRSRHSQTHYLDSFCRSAELSMKRVSRAPSRLSFVATMVYALYGRFQIETLGLKIENYKR